MSQGLMPGEFHAGELVSPAARELLDLAPYEPLPDQMRDRFAARFSATHELEMFQASGVSLREEVAAAEHRRRIAGETAAYTLLNDTVDRLFPPETVVHDPEGVTESGLVLSSLKRFKRAQSVTLHWASNDTPYVVVGSRDIGHRKLSQVLTLNLGTRKLDVARAHTGDLAAFQALSQYGGMSEMTDGDLQRTMTNDGNFFLGKNSPGSVRMGFGRLSRAVDLGRRGVRLEQCFGERSDITNEFRAGRLAESTVNEFSIPEHLADIASALITE